MKTRYIVARHESVGHAVLFDIGAADISDALHTLKRVYPKATFQLVSEVVSMQELVAQKHVDNLLGGQS